VNSIHDFIARFGNTEPFSWQMSRQDQRRQVSGNRTYFTSKDAIMAPVMEKLEDNHFPYMIDVDHHVDNIENLLSTPRPWLLYTRMPQHASGIIDGSIYGFNDNNEFVEHITGGAIYRHKLWNWNVDEFTVITSTRYVHYLVNYFNADELHAVVMLTPAWSLPIKPINWLSKIIMGNCRYYTAMALYPLLHYFEQGNDILLKVLDQDYVAHMLASRLAHRRLQRLEPVQHGMTHLKVSGRSETYHSVARSSVGSEIMSGSCGETSANLFDEIRVKFQQCKTVTLPAVKQLMSSKQQLKDGSAAAVFEFFSVMKENGVIKYSPAFVTPSDTCYQMVISNTDIELDAPTKLYAFMHPVYKPAYHPDSSLNNQTATVQKRVMEPNSKAKSKWTRGLADEVRCFVKHWFVKLQPCDDDSIYEHQKRPTQRVILDEAQAYDAAVRSATAFQKGETYPTPKEPRNITQYPGINKYKLSQFIYPLQEHLKTLRWYAFGCDAKVMDARIAHMAESSQICVLDDFSRMDATFTEVPRMIERIVLVYCFPEYVTEVEQAHKADYNCNCRTSGTKAQSGISYNTAFTRGSGSLLTSSFNTIIHAFLMWYAIRTSGFDIDATKEAMQKIIVGGDDGIAFDIDPICLMKCAEKCGFNLKVDVIHRGEPGVNFLARYHTKEVWYGYAGSVCDLPRQLGKLHLAPTARPPPIALFLKLLGYLASDRHVYVMRDILKFVFVEDYWTHQPTQNINLDTLKTMDHELHYKIINSGNYLKESEQCSEELEEAARFKLDMDWPAFDPDIFISELNALEFSPAGYELPRQYRFLEHFTKHIDRCAFLVENMPQLSQFNITLPHPELVNAVIIDDYESNGCSIEPEINQVEVKELPENTSKAATANKTPCPQGTTRKPRHNKGKSGTKHVNKKN